jgi:hypothetical protein
MDADLAKKELQGAREQILDSYIQESFLPKQHGLVRFVVMLLVIFILALAANQSMKTDPSRPKVEQSHNRKLIDLSFKW